MDTVKKSSLMEETAPVESAARLVDLGLELDTLPPSVKKPSPKCLLWPLAVAGLLVIATFGHRPVRAEAFAGPVSSFASTTGEERASTSAWTDPSLPSASSVLEHAVAHETAPVATF